MIDWNKSKISLEFVATSVDHRTMSLLIVHGNKLWKFLPLPDGNTVWSADICLPTTLSLIFGGKTQKDTKVDNDGNIISNMTVAIEKITLDGISCWEWWTELSTVLELDNRDDIVLGKTVCDNGRVDIKFDQSNAFFWLTNT